MDIKMQSPGKTAIFLSVRDKATRLPGKTMAPIEGKPALLHLIERLKTAAKPEMLVVTTSVNPGDDTVEAVARRCGVACFRGSEDDKLQRYLDAAKAYGVAFAAVVDGDDLFCEPLFIDRIIDAYRTSGEDYIICDGLPTGVTAFGIRIDALEKVVRLKAENDTEVWGGYFTDTGLFRCNLLPVEDRWKRQGVRMTLDYPEDLEFFKAVYSELYRAGEIFTLANVLDLLDGKPEIAAINRGCEAKFQQGMAKARQKIALKGQG
jgi:spore coat polysaccharide biosynthesis protein SpsF (cytidylyltransferase family)